MPTSYNPQAAARRFAELEATGRRCDGNSRTCYNGAVEEYLLLPAKGFEPLDGAEPVQKRSCSRHRQLFVNNELWHVVSTRRFPRWNAA